MNELYENGLLYDDLTPSQQEFFKRYIWNGVGSDHYWLNPHDLIFKTASVYHDFFFFRGGPDRLRRLADKDFKLRGLQEVKKQKWYSRPFYRIVAYVYYGGLKLFSKKAWEHYDTPAQTWEQFVDRVVAAFVREGRDLPWGAENPYTV